ncbi:MAG: beta-mannosidase [Bacteroidales bacterium]|nr:beta-mannosidase [Bacteroidales bacterium]
MKQTLILIATILLSASCTGADPIAESGRTVRTENLLSFLKSSASKGQFLFGHQDDTVYGVGWEGDSGRSDVQSVCGDYPALLGFDLGDIETGKAKNLDGVPFSRMREEIIRQFERDGAVTLSWHCNNPLSGGTAWVSDSLRAMESRTVGGILEEGPVHEKFLSWIDVVADFLLSLKTDKGVAVPVIFRPFHEHTGSWFWWGQANCTTEDFISLWRLTVERLREKGVANALFAYSTGLEAGGDPVKFMERYPGDGYIDILGMDFYCSTSESEADACAHYIGKAAGNLPMLCALAAEHGKAAAVTETGYEGIRTPHWWTGTLLPALADYPVSYVMVWRNAHDKEGHFYAPYPGHPSERDFVSFCDEESTLMVSDLKSIYE